MKKQKPKVKNKKKPVVKENNNDIFHEYIIKHKNDLPNHFNNNHLDIQSNSWFDIKKYDAYKHHTNIKLKNKLKNKEIIKCQKIKMILNSEQKRILDKWFYVCTKIYNEALTYIKNNYSFTKFDVTRAKLIDELNRNKNNDEQNFFNFYNIRHQLKDIKKNIQKQSKLEDCDKNTTIHIHTLDYSIKQLCTNIDSASTNLLRGNIKRFRLKYWRNNRCSKTIDIEKVNFKDNKLCPHIFGNIKYIYNKKKINLININSDVKINYNNITNEYLLLVPIKTINEQTENKTRNLICLDPGLRTFMTGVSEQESLEIGNNVNSIVAKDIRRLTKIQKNKNIPKRIKKKNKTLINRKISNKIDDLQWKSIKYLTNTYNAIYLGNMSAKSIVKNNKSVLNKYKKIACLRTKYFQFKMRLEYKCVSHNVHFKYVDESYTSKTCSECSYYDKDLGSSKIYICKGCPNIMERDINGARNIYIKSLI